MPSRYLPLIIGIGAVAPLLFAGIRIERKAKKALEPMELARLNAQNKKTRILGGAFGASVPLAGMFMPPMSSWMVILPFSLIYVAGNFYILNQAHPPSAYMRSQRKGSALLLASMLIFSISMFFEQRAFEAAQLSRKNAECPVEPASPNPSFNGTPGGAR